MKIETGNLYYDEVNDLLIEADVRCIIHDNKTGEILMDADIVVFKDPIYINDISSAGLDLKNMVKLGKI